MNLELTSNTTFYFLLFISTGSLLSIALFWNRIFRKGIRNLFVRLLLLILVQILIVISVGVGINRSQGFYSSWTDFFGGKQDFSSTAISANSLTQLSKKDLSKASKIGDLLVVKDTIVGEKSGVSNEVFLVLPQSAVNSIQKGVALNPAKYQVVEFLTGFPSKPVMWFKALNVERDIADFNKTHSREIIGVIPEINVDGQSDLECMNLPGNQPQAESWLTDDMRSYSDKRLGMLSGKWISAGVSTGGWCAFMFAVRKPNLYSGALSIAGYYRPALPLKDPIALQKSMIKKYDVPKMEQLLSNKVPMYLVASRGDIYSYRETQRFLAKKHPNLKIQYHEILTGGHNPRVWKSSITPGLNWLATNLNP